MATERKIIVAFDLYGTLLSTESISKELAKHFGEETAESMAAMWRVQQLEYTWRFNSMGQYIPFSDVNLRSLHHTLTEHDLELSEDVIASLLRSYDTLSTFPDVNSALKTLSPLPFIYPVIFSNGTNSMVSTSVQKSPSLSPYASVFKDLITVEEVQRFKPDPKVYEYLAKRMKKEGRMEEMWLVSGNPFDVVGARMMGMKAAWVDRAGKGWVDKCVEGEMGRPSVICRTLGEVVEEVRRIERL